MCATEVFQVLRSYDYTVMMYDDNGNQIYEPENARRMWAENGNVLVSLIEDKSEGEVKEVRLYVGKATKITEVLGLVQTLRTTTTKFAKTGTFTVNSSGKENINVADFATRSSVTEAGRNTHMNVLEGMYGTTRSSYLKLENARMIVRHTQKIDEMVNGSRGRHINSIFVENVQGERFLFPTQQLAPARAMTQHVNHGGGFADMVGQQIIRMAHDYANLGAASGYIAQNASGLQESALVVRETCRTRMHEMRKCFERLSRTSSGYMNESQRIEEKCKTLTEGNDETIIDITEVKNLLTLEDRELSETVLMSIAEAIKECECDSEIKEYGLPQKNDTRTKDIKDASCPACGGSGSSDNKLCKACDGSGVESISVLGKKLAASAWNDLLAKKLELFHTPVSDSSNSPKFTNKDAELSYKIGQIVPEVKNHSMSSFLGFVSERLPRNNDARTQKGLRMIAMSVIELVGMPLDDGISTNHVAVKEFSEWLAGFNSSIIFERDEDDYEYERSSFGDSDPTSHEYAASEEATEEAISGIIDNFDVNDFLESHGSDFGWGNLPEGGDLDYEKSYILRSLTGYLEKKAEDEYGIEDADMSDSAAYIWDKIEPTLLNAGYTLSEGEFSRSDVVIQTNQGADFKREVTKAASTDPFSGEMVPPDLAYLSRMKTLSGLAANK